MINKPASLSPRPPRSGALRRRRRPLSGSPRPLSRPRQRHPRPRRCVTAGRPRPLAAPTVAPPEAASTASRSRSRNKGVSGRGGISRDKPGAPRKVKTGVRRQDRPGTPPQPPRRDRAQARRPDSGLGRGPGRDLAPPPGHKRAPDLPKAITDPEVSRRRGSICVKIGSAFGADPRFLSRWSVGKKTDPRYDTESSSETAPKRFHHFIIDELTMAKPHHKLKKANHGSRPANAKARKAKRRKVKT